MFKPKKMAKGNTTREGEGSLYDKIMRENLLELFLPLVAETLNFTPINISPLPDKQPTTVLRETDAFLLIETNSETEPKFILHIEFESKDNEEMIYRVSEYHGIELRKYKLPIKHVVVYLGEGKSKMRATLKKEEIFEGFTLVVANSFSPKKWLAEEEPQKILMAILGDYQRKNAEIILEAIVLRLRKVCKTDGELKKIIEQLIILSRMRNLEGLTIKVSKAMPVTIDIEKDYLYNLGLKKADALVKQARDAATKAKKQLEKLAKEKVVLQTKAKVEAEKARVARAKAKAAKIKAEKEKAALQAKAKAMKIKVEKEKAVLQAKAKSEAEKVKAALQAEAKSEKKMGIQKMKAKNKFSDEEIMEFLNLDKKMFLQYLEEIESERK